MKEIILKTGEKAVVDDEDYDLVKNLKWYTEKSKNTIYARALISKGKLMKMHRLILGIIDENIYVDHKDRNGLNNRRSNLRACTASDNMKNRNPFGTSKYCGVSLHGGRWLSKITIDGKQKYIGLFSTEEAAAKAYNEMAIKSGNPFFNINQV